MLECFMSQLSLLIQMIKNPRETEIHGVLRSTQRSDYLELLLLLVWVFLWGYTQSFPNRLHLVFTENTGQVILFSFSIARFPHDGTKAVWSAFAQRATNPRLGFSLLSCHQGKFYREPWITQFSKHDVYSTVFKVQKVKWWTRQRLCLLDTLGLITHKVSHSVLVDFFSDL